MTYIFELVCRDPERYALGGTESTTVIVIEVKTIKSASGTQGEVRFYGTYW